MNRAEEILEAMSEINEKYLRESEEGERRWFFSLKPAFGVLVTAALVICAFIMIPRSNSADSATNIAFNPAGTKTAVNNEEDAREAADGEFAESNDQAAYAEEMPSELGGLSNVLIMPDLLKALNDLPDGGTVWIQAEIEQKSELLLTDVQKPYFPSGAIFADHAVIAEMTKQEIMSFEGDPDTVYRFHLVQEDEIH